MEEGVLPGSGRGLSGLPHLGLQVSQPDLPCFARQPWQNLHPGPVWTLAFGLVLWAALVPKATLSWALPAFVSWGGCVAWAVRVGVRREGETQQQSGLPGLPPVGGFARGQVMGLASSDAGHDWTAHGPQHDPEPQQPAPVLHRDPSSAGQGPSAHALQPLSASWA